jgi:sortase (surface protein transpeptidase)
VTRHRHAKRGGPAAFLAVAAGLAVIGVGVAGLVLSRGSGAAPGSPLLRVPAPDGPAAGVPWPGSRHPVARPVRLIVPAIGVRTPLIRLGLTTAGTLQVPASTGVAGWYDRSPRPGQTGAAIIAGHIDSLAGPAVFFRLASLRAGDRAYVRRADGTLAVFRVTAVRTYLKSRFPTAAVYGAAPGPQLRLITCGGTFDHTTGSYLSNVIVYAVEIGHPRRR